MAGGEHREEHREGVAGQQIPLNLPHAATIANRIVYHLRRVEGPLPRALELRRLLEPYQDLDDNPPEGVSIAAQAAEIGRALVDEIEAAKCGDDRLGQCVRNLFECLELGDEGAELSLRAGENPNSALRP